MTRVLPRSLEKSDCRQPTFTERGAVLPAALRLSRLQTYEGSACMRHLGRQSSPEPELTAEKIAGELLLNGLARDNAPRMTDN
jgi:hypothetical protein